MKLMKKIKIKRFIISLFLSFIFFTTYLNANSLNNLVVLETLNSQDRFEYSGFLLINPQFLYIIFRLDL